MLGTFYKPTKVLWRHLPSSPVFLRNVDVQQNSSHCPHHVNKSSYLSRYYHIATDQKHFRFAHSITRSDLSCHRKNILQINVMNSHIEFYKHFCEHQSVKQGYLEGVKDRFNGVQVDLSQFSDVQGPNRISGDLFDSILSSSLDLWKTENVTCVWLKVPIELSHLISVASQHDFEYHHAEGKIAVLCLWMDDNVECRIPRFATHQIGVSGVVINEKNHEVLVVKDKNRKHKLWKFPGGLSDLGEDIAATAVREVLEETGIHTEFKSILAFRQQHVQPNAFGRSDIYILCRMKPLSFELHPCCEEIEAAQWMPLEQIFRMEDTSAFSCRVAELVKQGLRDGFQTVDITPNHLESTYLKSIIQMFHRPLDNVENV